MEISIQSLIEVGAHFGHELKKWNPKDEGLLFIKNKEAFILLIFKKL